MTQDLVPKSKKGSQSPTLPKSVSVIELLGLQTKRDGEKRSKVRAGSVYIVSAKAGRASNNSIR